MRIPVTPPDVDPSGRCGRGRCPGSYATKVLGRGTRLRLIDPDGGACATAALPLGRAMGRLNVADTVKVWPAISAPGNRCSPIRAACWRRGRGRLRPPSTRRAA